MLPNQIKLGTALLLSGMLTFFACTKEQDVLSSDGTVLSSLEIKKFYQELYAKDVNVFALVDSNMLVQYAAIQTLNEEKRWPLPACKVVRKYWPLIFAQPVANCMG